MRSYITLAVVLLAVFGSIQTATYYVSPTGDDANDGSISTPWKSPGKFRDLTPGDTGYFRAGTYQDVYIHGSNNPNLDYSKPVTLAAYQGEAVTITGSSTYGNFFNLFDASYHVDGIRFESCTVPGLWMFISNAHNSTVTNTYFGECDSTALQIRLSDNVIVRNNTFYKNGNPVDQGESDNMYVVGSNYVLIEYNHFSYGAHAACDVIDYLGTNSSHVILQHNVVEAHWGGGLYIHRGTTHVVMQDNVILYAGEGTPYPKTGIQVAQQKAIIRRNVVAKTDKTNEADYCFVLNAFVFSGQTLSSIHNRIYNNILFECGYYALKVNQKDWAVIEDNKFLNNIMYRAKTEGDYEQFSTRGNYTIGYETYHANADFKWGTNFAINRTYFESNIILNADATTDKPGDISVYWLELSEFFWNVTSVESQFPTVFHHNYEFNPGFVDEENNDFNLRPDSKSIDAGSHLTKTTSSGSATTTLTVEDAFFFTDGYGMIDGDMIRVGDNDAVMVTSVDFDTKTLTVKTPISFNMGDFVSLDYYGAAPDVGAYEFYVAPPPKAPTTPSNNGPSGNTPGSSLAPGSRTNGAETVVPAVSIIVCAIVMLLSNINSGIFH